MTETFLLIVFESTHMAIKTEKKLKGLDVDIIPTPRELSVACGISIKASLELLESIKKRMGDDYGHLSKFYEVTKEKKVLTFRLI